MLEGIFKIFVIRNLKFNSRTKPRTAVKNNSKFKTRIVSATRDQVRARRPVKSQVVRKYVLSSIELASSERLNTNTTLTLVVRGLTKE